MAGTDTAGASSSKEKRSTAAEARPITVLPPEHWARARDYGSSDEDSTLQDITSTVSITSSILKYRTILGRTFHGERGGAQYWGSNDDKQSEAMDINHHCQTLALGDRLYLAPISQDIKNAVDIGTGTGIWAIDFAEAFPQTRVVGTDISPIQPSWLLPNLEFRIEDCTQEWDFPPSSLDYVHIRFLSGSVADWGALFKQAYRCLRPGGILESMEPSPYIESDDNSINEKSALSQWGKIFVEGGKKSGRPFTVIQDNLQNKAMDEAGFVDVHEWKFKSPIGAWPEDPKLREIGQCVQVVLEQDSEGLILFMANVLGGWSKEEIQVYISHVRREMQSDKTRCWYWQKVVWGRKPESAT